MTNNITSVALMMTMIVCSESVLGPNDTYTKTAAGTVVRLVPAVNPGALRFMPVNKQSTATCLHVGVGAERQAIGQGGGHGYGGVS